MLKRAIAILFISISNFVLLAHVIIPHHHHETEVCIVNTHCKNISNAHDHELNKDSHEHDGNSESDYCLLKQLVLIPTQRGTQDLNESDLLVDTDHSDMSKFGLISSPPDLSGLEAKRCKLTRFLFENYILLTTSGQGLRAPPIA